MKMFFFSSKKGYLCGKLALIYQRNYMILGLREREEPVAVGRVGVAEVVQRLQRSPLRHALAGTRGTSTTTPRTSFGIGSSIRVARS